MKKTLLFSLTACLIFGNPAIAQVSGLLKKAKNSVTNELLGNNDKSTAKTSPEPSCACNDAELVVGLGGSLKLDYKELTISVADDGRILAKDRISGKYYIIKNGVSQGPYSEGDPKLADFQEISDDNNSMEALLIKYKSYISKSGEKYKITFDGKNYGPYARIENFVVTKAKNQFAATVVDKVIATEDQGKKIEAAMNNAKTDQERMDIAMKFSQQMQQNILSGGNPEGITPKLITNVIDEPIDQTKFMTAVLNGNAKYDEILLISYDKITNLKGNPVMTIKPEDAGAEKLFINSSNTRYAIYGYGTLTFSDGTTMNSLFNPGLIKTDGKIYLTYMYYSPKNNALMQCKIPF
ncbi:MAG: hypothetical protein LLG13_07815 [Bacteroidales bacterium]|nr:hypothetical protein [Bacteroidales bacterium]